jgi:hypothetical protein
MQFVATRHPRPRGVRPTDGKVDGDDQLALADHHDKQHPVNAREHPVFLIELPAMVGGVPEATDYVSFVEYNIRTMLKAVQGG